MIFNIQNCKRVALHILFWFAVWFLYSYFFGFNSNNNTYVFWFASILIPVTIVNTYFTIYYLFPKYLLTKKYYLFVLYAIYALIIAAFIISIAMFFGFVYLGELTVSKMPPLSRSLPLILLIMYLVIIVVSAFKLALYNYHSLEKQKDLENKLLQTELLLKKEELKFLKMQIHPHFLFNTLNTLYGFALKKSAETPQMILKLSSLLDYILYQVEKPSVLLQKEVAHIEDYIALEKMRFQDGLSVNFIKNGMHNDFLIAPMLLLPFVENSFKHAKVINGVTTIDMNLQVTKEKMCFTIENRMNTSKLGKGIGLKNIQKRLEMLYKDAHTLTITQKDAVFKVTLSINQKI